MSSSERISQRFNMFYDEIDTQMSQLHKSDSIFSQFSMQSDDAKMLNRIERGEVPMENVDELIRTAKEFDEELQSFIEKNNLRKKVAQRKLKTTSMKSEFPPIWNDAKLSKYIDSIIDEVLVSSDEEQEIPSQKTQPKSKPTAPVLKTILKTDETKNRKRNAATNVKFQIHPPKVDDDGSQKGVLKKSNKKVQAILNCPQFKLDSTGGTLFPCRTELLTNRDESLGVIKPKPTKDLPPKTAPFKLKHSPLTVTSTSSGKVKGRENIDDDVVEVKDSNLATAKAENSKQMTTKLLPVLSIKGSCSIQKIYQLEISPSLETGTKPVNDKRGTNTRLLQYVYKPLMIQSPTLIKSPLETSTAPVKTSDLIPQVSTAAEVEDGNQNFFGASAINKHLKDNEILLRDGKIHVVVKNGCKRRNIRKTKMLRTLKPSTLRKSIDEQDAKEIEAADNENLKMKKKINICDGFQQEQKEEANDEKDSSMSSSITDDGKIRQILKINLEHERRSRGWNSSSESHPESSLNVETSAEPAFVDVERAVAENFESIYKLIEDTFQPSDSKEVKAESDEKEQKAEENMDEMKEVIKMSEENIKRAGMMLQKYQKPKERFSLISEKLSKDETENELNSVNVVRAAQFSDQEIQTQDIVLEIPLQESQKQTETVDSCAQTSEDKIVQTDVNENLTTQQYYGSVYDKYSNFNHIKLVQPQAAVRHNPFPSIYDPCSCVACDQKRKLPDSSILSQQGGSKSFSQTTSLLAAYNSISASSKLSVPYNINYLEDDEVMKAAEKFLRSVEKRKNRNAGSDSVSSEVTSSNGFSPQKIHSLRSSSSTSTPSSSLLLQNIQQKSENTRQVPRACNNLQERLSKASDGLASIEQRFEDLQLFTGESQSKLFPSSASHQFDSLDSQENQDPLERYLSEGEVMSQGEIQFRLSDDADFPDDFF